MNTTVIIVVSLLIIIAACIVSFAFSPLGLGPEPDSALGPEFFTEKGDLSSLELLVDGEEAFSNILEAIDSSESSIIVQTFIWKDDNIGRQVVAKLMEAADRGVQVTVRKDALGTFFEVADIFKGKASPVFSDKGFRANDNIDISVDPFADTDHSKYFIIDNKTVIFGGMNIADEYHKNWRDYMVKIDNAQWAQSFADKVLRSTPWPTDTPYTVVSNDRRATEIRTALLQTIAQAKQSIILEHAYFSDAKVMAALDEAMARRVKIDLILPKAPDTHLYANRATINKLMSSPHRGNLRVLLYPGMSHAKVALMDGTIAIIGSANLTPRSMLTSREVTLFAHGAHTDVFIKELYDQLMEDINASEWVDNKFEMSFKERVGALIGKYTY